MRDILVMQRRLRLGPLHRRKPPLTRTDEEYVAPRTAKHSLANMPVAKAM